MIFAETVERQNKAFKMLDLPGIKFVLSICILSYANAQFTDVCTDNVNLCGASTECFNRPPPTNADPSTLAYVCDCGSSLMVADDCRTVPPPYRTDRPQESFITCYGDSCSTGSFQSLNYPNLYEDRWTAIYLLYIPRASRIDFTFTGSGGFGVETLKDELYVGTGLTFSSADFTGVDIMDNNRVVRFFDNSTLNGQTYPPPFSFETDSVWLYFLTDKNVMFNGWQLSWTSTVDNTPPTVNFCPSNMERVLERGGQQFVSITWTQPIASDISNPVTSFQSHTPGSNFFIGTTTVTYTFFDRFGTSANCMFDVTVIEADSQPPVISGCPDPIMREEELGTTEISVIWIEPTAIDVPPGPVDLESRSFAPGSFFPVPATLGQVEIRTVSYVFADANLNRATCVFTVSVTAVDTTPPVINGCPGVQSGTVEVGTNDQASIVWTEPTATDISGTAALIQRTHPPGSLFPSGVTSVTYTFADSSTNEATCQFNVVVTTVDTRPPVPIGCPTIVPATVELGVTGTAVSWVVPTATDLSGLPVTIVPSRQPNSFFVVGSTDVTYTFTDQAGNMDQCSFRVIVSEIDTIPPQVFSCPNTVPAIIELGLSQIAVSWQPPFATDASEPPQVTVASTAAPGDLFPPGPTNVVYTFTDSSGNANTCEFTVQVTTVDTTPPQVIFCPTDQPVLIQLGGALPQVSWIEPVVTDLSAVTTLNQGNPSGSTFPVGTTQINYVFTDTSDNLASCSFNVIVSTEDTIPPTISGCPADIIETVELGIESRNVVWIEPTATDASVAQLSERSHSPGNDFPADQSTLVSYVFVDGFNNMARCEFSVRILTEDTIAPMCVDNPATIFETVELGTPRLQVRWTPPTCSDLSGTAFVNAASVSPPTFFSADTTTAVTHTCLDLSGNEGSCSFSVVIQSVDTTPPTIIDGPTSITRTIELGENGIVVSWAELSSQDISGTQRLISQSHFSDTRFQIGNTLVTYVYGDDSGNTATHVFCVNVETVDRIPPTIASCPTSGVAVTVELGETSGPAFWQAITATDLSNVANLVSQTAAPGDPFVLGMTAVMYIFTDASGNRATCSFTVTVTPVDTLPPVISGCPGVIREVVELGSQETIVIFSPPTATDFSGVATVTPSHSPGTFFPVGPTSVTYRFEDATGNFDMCTFVINVVTEDTTAPECVGLPENIVLTVELGMQGSMVTWEPPTCSDNGFASVTGSTASPGTFFMVDPTGTLVTYTCTDNAGLSTDCSFRVIVTTEDTIAPMCQDVPVNTIGTVELGSGTETAVTWRPPTCVDLSPTTQISSASPGDFFSIGTTTVTVTCFDSSGNDNSCDFIVTVIEVDNTAPQCLGVPAGASAEVELGINTQTVSWIEPTCIDASGTAVRTSTSSPGSSFPVGVTPVIYTCTDVSGNVGTCSSFDVLVIEVDTLAPTILNCPVPGSVGAVIELGTITTMVSWREPTATDLSGGTSVAQRSHAPGSSFRVGDTIVTYIFQDSAGNTAPCQFTVSVTTVDTTPPVITGCPNMASTTVELGEIAGVVTWIEPTATDLSGVAVLSTSGGVTGDMFPIGQTVVMYTFVDDSGNAGVCTIIVTVGTVDTTSPVISGCPTNEFRQVELGSPGTTVTWTEPSATDTSGQAPLQARSHAPGAFFDVGNAQVTYTFSDPNGNEAICAFTVSVVTIDTIGPTCVGAPASGVIETVELGQPGRIASWATISCDDLSGMAFVSDSTSMSGSFFTVGETTVTVTCQDGSGNTGTCSFTVTIVEIDTVQPTCVGLPGNVLQTIELGMQAVVVTWVAPTCDDLSPTTSSSSQNPGDSFPVGNTEVVLTCIDSAGNRGSCSFTVTVQEVDTTDPQCVGLPVGVGGTAEVGGIPGAMVSWIPPTCADLSTTTIQGSRDPGAFFPLGSTTVSYTCTDASGNRGQCSFDVIVATVDTTPPMCTGLPADILRFVELGSSGDFGVNWSLPTCADASNTGRILTSSADPLDFFPIGTTVVTYTCIDDTSLTSTCSFVVDIQNVDTTPPTITGCPDNQEIVVELGLTSARAFWTAPTATDLSGQVTLVGIPPQPGQTVSVGTMTVLYTFQDSSMNQASCQFTITVTPVDRIPPDITGCPVVVEEEVELGMTGSIVTWTGPTATDISGQVSLVTPAPPSFFVVGLTTVTYTFADGSGNQATCTFMVSVIEVDTIPPAISNCPPDRIVTIELGQPGTEVNWLEPTVTDLSGTALLISRSNPPNSFFRVGDTTVTYVFQDPSGNEAICRFVVTVTPVDSMPPVIVGCPEDIEAIIELGTPRAMVDWIEPFSSDASGTDTLISRSHAPGELFIIGRTTVVYIFGDNSGNRATCSFGVIVTAVDTTPPTISNCRTDSLDVTVEFGVPGITVQWQEPTATDISSVTLSSRSDSPNDFFPVGQTMVTYVFTDDAGNTATCEFCIIVLAVDTVDPVCVGVPSDFFQNVELGIPSAVVSWTEPTCQDSDVASLTARTATSPSPFAVDQRTEVTFTCTDRTGNTGTCSFFVTVSSVDSVPPVISGCPGDISRTVELGLAGLEVSWLPPTATDISGTVNLQPVTSGPGSFFRVAQTPVTYRFSDQSGNIAECNFLVIVTTIDTTPPVIADCPTPDIRREVELGTPSLIIAYPEPTATDLSNPVTVITNCRSGDTYTIGETLCTYTFSDQMGNPNTCVFTIIVTSVDTTPPVCVDLPGPIVEVVELGTPGAVLFWTPPSCTDPPGAAFIFSSTASPGDFFPVGARDVEYICQDSVGLRTTCTFPVTVTTVDTTPPTVVCTEDVAVTLELGQAGRMVSWVEPTATDISSVATLQSRSHAVGTFFSDPSTTVSYIFIDSAGNTATCSFCVRLQFVDTTDPQIDCPVLGPVVVEIRSGGTTVTWLPPTAMDLSPTTVTCTNNPGDFFITGLTSVTCTAIDDFGNNNQCSFDVEVREVDSIPPVVTCPPDVNVVIEVRTGPATVDLPLPTVSDNSLMVPTLVTQTPPGNIFGVGVTPVTFTYQDLAGNVNSCTYTVTVTEVDTLDPIISGCPADITETTPIELRECRASWPEPQVSDNSGVVTLFDQSHSPNSVFSEGVTIVTYTYSDPTGNLADCSFSVTCTPVDEVQPIVTCPPTFQSQTSLEVPFCIVTNLPEPQAFDNSGTVFLLSQNPPATTTQYTVGDTTVTFTYQDPSGNQGSCTLTVRCIEVDEVDPIVTCPPTFQSQTSLEVPLCTVNNLPQAQAMDNSGTVFLLSQIPPATTTQYTVGDTTVTFTYQDPSGNQGSCTFTVRCIEVDEVQPIVTCPPTFQSQTSLEVPLCTVNNLPEAQAFDNSGTVFLLSQNPPATTTQYTVGDTTVTFTYQDPSGNQGSCTFTVRCIEVDEVDPIVTCPPTFQSQTSLEVPFCTVNNLPQAQAMDNSGTVFLLSQIPPATSTQYTVGDTTVTFTYQDPSGNQGSCTFTVRCIEVDDVLPLVTCPQDVTTVVIEGLPGTTVTFNEPLPSDNSGTATISSITPQSNSFFQVGSSPVVVIVSDPSGNTAQCTFNVIVQPGNPCDPNPCSNGGFCAIDSLSGFTCVCTECFEGRTCDISVDACANNQCQNGGACVAAPGACDHYRCECPPCFSGEFCQDFRDACENHQCQGGSTCCPDNNCLSYSCQCAPCFDGPYCETEINSCEIHNCQNNAQCVPDLLGDCSGYTCSCTGCFTGELCTEVMNACQPNPCINGGFCSPDAVDCYRYNCRCNGCFTGTRCEIAIPDPCLPNPCLNGGICTNVGGSCSSFTCECQKGNIGILCETVQVDNSNPCNSFPCENGASCVESGSNYICLCRTRFAGINCGQTTDSLTQTQLACSTNPCRNGALCVNSYHSASNNFVYEAQYTCRCSTQFTGQDCQDFVQIAVTFCAPNPCSNGGSCNNAYHSFLSEVDYVCTCPVGFRGQDCESDVGNPCDSSPCENGGTCTPFNTYFTCTCLTGFSGDYCQTPSGVGPPINVVSCPADITMDAVGGSVQATWGEPNAFGGVGTVSMSYQSHNSGDFFTVGETPVTYVFTDSTLRFAECTFFVIVRSPNRCTPNPCQNGGRCLQSGSSLCDCTGTGFTGNTCQTPIPVNRCTPNPCQNGGRCLQSGVTLCDCTGTGFTGNTCQTSTPVNRCIPNPCQNGGRCLQAGGTLCDCTGTGFTGNSCQTSTVSATPCPADIVQTTNLALTPVTWIETTGGLFFVTQRSSDSGASFPIGQTTVTLSYFDFALSLILDCTFTINLIGAGPLPTTPVRDTIPPVFLTCPNDMIFDNLPPAAAGFDISIPWTEPTYDDEGGTIRANQTHSPGGSFRVGDVANVVYTIVDLAGNAATCEFIISLQILATGRRKRDVDITFTKHETEACPCLNGGVCLNVEDERTSLCHCPEEYSGMLCEVDQTDGNGLDFNQQLPFVAVVGVLVIIIGILAIALCQVSKHLSRRKQMVKEDEVAIIN